MTKQDFLKKVTVLCDTREQENAHILTDLDKYSVKHISRKLDFGDYSFMVDDKDFSLSAVIERKGSINELWGNVTKDRQRFEKELSSISSLAKSGTLLIEGVEDWQSLKGYTVPEWEMSAQNRQVKDIGVTIYSTLKSWSSSNRYSFDVVFCKDKQDSAGRILEVFYWFYHNYKEQLKPIKKP